MSGMDMRALDRMEAPDIETASDDYAQRFSGVAGEYFLEVQRDIVVELVEAHPGVTVLDVGGGHAQLTVPLAKMNYWVVVTGSHKTCRARLDRFLGKDQFLYSTCNQLRLPFRDSQFDVVLSFRMMPHLSQWRRFISELCRVSKHAVIVDYPDVRSFNVLYHVLFHLKKAVEKNTRPYRLFRRREIIEEFIRNGFGNPSLHPEFFLPMVVHRTLKSKKVSRKMEDVFNRMGMTCAMGSPIVLSVTKL